MMIKTLSMIILVATGIISNAITTQNRATELRGLVCNSKRESVSSGNTWRTCVKVLWSIFIIRKREAKPMKKSKQPSLNPR